MVRTIVIRTAEIDDVGKAIEELKSQLGSASSLLKNTIGIVSCHYEFVYSGMLKAVCQALPFDIVGAVSSAQSVADSHGSLLFTLMILTSDDVRFEKTLTPPLSGDPAKTIAESYSAIAAKTEEKPALLLAFAPFMPENSGDEYVNTLSRVSGGVPCFGTIVVDDTLDFTHCYVLSDGEHHREMMAVVLVYGNLQPKFYAANVSKSKIFGKSAVVTKSAGHVIMELNNRPIAEYFDGLGLQKASETGYAMTALPFFMDYNDDTPMVTRAFIGLTPERHAIFAGEVPEGSALSIASTDKDDLLLTAGEAADLFLKDIDKASGLLIYTCVGRSMMLGADQFSEIELIKEKISGRLPFMMTTSGGEFCPTKISDEKAINRFHNNSFVACLF
ncbi:MAG: FIST C-terminal domain-containing protein [Treponema sp.]|nr:FIST C-terminal domain-containing protein [Treponema sp.]